MEKLLKKPLLKFIDTFIHLRLKFFPSFYIKSEQFFLERKIEAMHNISGYAAFSELLRSFIPRGVKTLDLGCNKGLETSIIAKTNPVMGVDLYRSFIRAARKRGINASVMDFHSLSFFEEFDCIYSNNTLEHSKFPDKVIKGVFRALKPGGIFIVGMPLDGNNPKIKDPAHFFRATEKDVVDLLKNNGFYVKHKEVVDTKQKWQWEIPPANNQMIIVVAKKT